MILLALFEFMEICRVCNETTDELDHFEEKFAKIVQTSLSIRIRHLANRVKTDHKKMPSLPRTVVDGDT
jgi:hypothetical protein